MKLDLVDPRSPCSIAATTPDGSPRQPSELAQELEQIPRGTPVRLTSATPLSAPVASALFRTLAKQGRAFTVKLAAETVVHKGAIDEAARAGCVAIEIERQGMLVAALGSATFAARQELQALITALRRVRGLGMATVARLPLGMPGDDEGVFDRTLRFCRRALISVPLPEPYSNDATPVELDPTAADSRSIGSMERASLENGLGWLRARLGRHLAIWRRALWPTGSRNLTLSAGYQLRRETARGVAGRYTPTMHLLRLLNRTKRARRAERMLSTRDRDGLPEASSRGSLRTFAWSDARLGALFIQVEGALDVRGARALLQSVTEACQAGFQRITIDFRGLDRVSFEVVTRFLAENRTRLLELASYTRLHNLGGVVDSLRRQLGDLEPVRWLESAALHA